MRDGEIPLDLLFSGTVFYTGAGGALQINRISWNAEAAHRLPVRVWRETMDHYFPDSAWLRLDRETFDRLVAFRARGGADQLGGRPRRPARSPRRGAVTAADPIRAIADAVLYEGYVLWPYRRSALKNAQRWTFGGVYPRAHARARAAGDDPWTMQTQCLVEGGAATRVGVGVRFLHVVWRQVVDADGREVDELVAGGERHLTWEEAVEREVTLEPVALARAGGRASGADPRSTPAAPRRGLRPGARWCAAGSGSRGRSRSPPSRSRRTCTG